MKERRKGRRTFYKGIFALSMCCLGMLLCYGPVQTQRQEETVTLSEKMIPSSAQPAPADERKEEKNSTTSQLYAQSAVLMDAENGRILLEKNATQVLAMASTTKIMTCILTLEIGNPEDMAPVSAYAAGQPKVHLGAVKGEYYKIGDLLYSLMLESHNDAAVIIAEYYGSQWAGLSTDCASHSREESQKAVMAFTQKMNEKAEQIGCKDTFFVTPNGLDGVYYEEIEGKRIEKAHATTATDLALIMRYCVRLSPAAKDFLQVTQVASYSFPNYKKTEGGTAFVEGSRQISCTNHNAFLQMMEGAISGKTGFTGKAGYCYVGALEQNGKSFVVALLACGWPNHKTWKWHDTRLLMEYGLENYERHDLYVEKKLENIPVENGQLQETALKIEQQKIELLLGPKDRTQVDWELPESLDAPVARGQQVGRQIYYVNGEIYAQIPITAALEVPKITFLYCLKKVLGVVFL